MAKAPTETHKLELVREDNSDGSAYEYYPLGEHVVIAPGVCGGRPTFKGTRVEVRITLDWLRLGRDIDRILAHIQKRSPRGAHNVSLAIRKRSLHGRSVNTGD